MWFDWTNQTKPQDFSISYNRQYNKKALEHELNEINLSLNVLEKYENMFGDIVPDETYTTQAEAEARAVQLGGSGSHSHTQEDGTVIYMPFNTHRQYELALNRTSNDQDVVAETEFKTEMRDKIRLRLKQLLSATTTDNGF